MKRLLVILLAALVAAGSVAAVDLTLDTSGTYTLASEAIGGKAKASIAFDGFGLWASVAYPFTTSLGGNLALGPLALSAEGTYDTDLSGKATATVDLGPVDVSATAGYDAAFTYSAYISTDIVPSTVLKLSFDCLAVTLGAVVTLKL